MGKLLGVVPVWGCAGNHRLGGRTLSREKADTGAWTVNAGVQVPLTAVDAAAWWDLEAAGKG